MDTPSESCQDPYFREDEKAFSDLPTEQDVSNAMLYLAQTDKSEADARKRLEGLKKAEKIVMAGEYIRQRELMETKATESQLNHMIYASEAYSNWKDSYEEAIADLAVIQNRRNRAQLVTEFWRSLNSARAKGMQI